MGTPIKKELPVMATKKEKPEPEQPGVKAPPASTTTDHKLSDIPRPRRTIRR